MIFEAELALEGVEDGFDPLPDAAESAEAGFLALAVRADQRRAQILGDERFEFPPGEALVTEDELSFADEVVVVLKERLGDLAFTDFRVRQAPDDRHAVGGADQVEPESPKVAGVGGAVAVTCVAG